MPALVLKSVPHSLHKRLKHEATLHRRSMTQEAIHLLEQCLSLPPAVFPSPRKGARPLTRRLLEHAIREGRA